VTYKTELLNHNYLMILTARLSDLTNSRDNNFNLMRLGAAIMVVLSHSFILSYNEPNSIPRGIGYLAVNCFFIMSGFLVCKSVIQRRGTIAFFKARMLRIYPALILAILFCVLVIGPINTTTTLFEYFTHLETYKFLFKNSLLVLGVEFHLPSVFGSVGPERMVNAPIWTLVYEIYLYVFLGILGAITLKNSESENRLFKTLVITFSSIALVLYVYNITQKGFDSRFFGNIVRFSSLFGIGAVFYVLRYWIKLSPIILILLVILLGISISAPLIHKAVLYPIIGYVLIYIAYIPKGLLLQFNKVGDYSYGVYIFAYPIQQSISHWYKGLTTIELFVSSLTISLVLAMMSWHCIEKRALRLKGQIRNVKI